MYRTVDEFTHFNFKDAEIFEIRREKGHLVWELGYVTILGDNSCNRDIRDMGTHALTLTLHTASDIVVIKEGYKVYDADGNLKETFEDEVIAESEFETAFGELEHSHIYSFEKQDSEYICSIDTEENTYEIRCKAKSDVAEWERFANKDSAY